MTSSITTLTASGAGAAGGRDMGKLELDSASAFTTRNWLDSSDEDELGEEEQQLIQHWQSRVLSADGAGQEGESAHLSGGEGEAQHHQNHEDDDDQQQLDRIEGEGDRGAAAGSGQRKAKLVSKRSTTAVLKSPARKNRQQLLNAKKTPGTAGSLSKHGLVDTDEVRLEPTDALKLKVVIEATAPALLHFRKGSRQVPLRHLVPLDPALHSASAVLPYPKRTDEASLHLYQTQLKSSWPTPERVERLKTIGIVQLPRDLEAEADQADGFEQDSFATLSDALEAAIASAAEGEGLDARGATNGDESREEEDFVRLRNVIFLVSSIRRQFVRLLKNPSASSSVLEADQIGRHLPHLRHKDFRIVSQPTAPKEEEDSSTALAVNGGSQSSPKAPGAGALAAPVPIALSRADTALTTIWTQAWFTEILRGSTLAMALLNELAERKRQDEGLVARVADAAVAYAGNNSGSGSRKRARLDTRSSRPALIQQHHPSSHYAPKLAMHMRLGAYGDLFTNAADMPRKYWDRQRGAAVGQFAAEGDEESTDDEAGHGSDEDSIAAKLRRRGRRSAQGGGGGGSATGGGGGQAVVDAALMAAKRGKPKGSGKGMGKGWRKGRTKAMEESEEVNREEERRRDRWALGDIEFGSASVVAIAPQRAASGIEAKIPTLGERLRAKGPAADLSALATSKSCAEVSHSSTQAVTSVPAQKRLPGRFADFLYYDQFSSFAPTFDTSRSTASGEATTEVWWTGRQVQNRLKRFHAESRLVDDGLSEELVRAFGGIPQPPAALEGPDPSVEIQEPARLLDDDEIKEALAEVQDVSLPSGETLTLDPQLWDQVCAQTSANGDAMDVDAEQDEQIDAGDDKAADADADADIDEQAAITDAVLQQNQSLIRALVVLQGQRLLAQVQSGDAAAKSGRTHTAGGKQDHAAKFQASEPLPVERLIARQLLSSLGVLVSLRPHTDTANLVPSTSALRSASASALLPTVEPAYWGTLPQQQYVNTVPPVFIDQIHRELGRKGPIVLKDNLTVQLATPIEAEVELQNQAALHNGAAFPAAAGMSGFPPPAAALRSAAIVPGAGPGAYGRLYQVPNGGPYGGPARIAQPYLQQQQPMIATGYPTQSAAHLGQYNASPAAAYARTIHSGVAVRPQPGALGHAPAGGQASYNHRFHLLQRQQQQQYQHQR
ncbi:hypothetical protein V8E36_002419 [Tilletia maclaganii]